jgi:hypothetical protein
MLRTSRFLVSGCSVLALVAGPALAATWDGGGDNATWTDALNWDGPDTLPISTSDVFLNNTASNRTITTPGTATTINRLAITQSSNAVSTLVLGADLTLNITPANYVTNNVISNTSGSAANVVIDLNGHTLANKGLYELVAAVNNGFTITTSAAGGKLKFDVDFNMQAAQQAGWNKAVIGSGVTAETYGGVRMRGSWDANTTVKILANPNGTGYGGIWGNPGGIGNLVIGDSSSSINAKVVVGGLINSNTLTSYVADPSLDVGGYYNLNVVKGDVTINNDSNGNAAIFLFATGASTGGFNTTYFDRAMDFRVGGNWTDQGTGAIGYGGNVANTQRQTITFNGGAVTERTVSIQRQSIITDFAVGDSTGIAGRVKLLNDLKTTGWFTLRGTSRLNLDDKTLDAGKFIGTAGMTLDLTFSDADSGIVNVTTADGLTLPDFTLNLTQGGSWTDGNDLVLFTYTGTQIAAPVLTLGTVPVNFTYDALMTDGGQVYLTNVSFVPEPSTMVLAGLGGLMLGWRRRSR